MPKKPSAKKQLSRKQREEALSRAFSEVPAALNRISYTEAERRADGARLVAEDTMIAGTRRLRVDRQLKLDTYNKRAQINDRQYAAGVKFHRLWIAALLTPKIIASYGDVLGGGGGDDSVMEAREALDAVLRGAGLARERQDVVTLRRTDGSGHLVAVKPPVDLTPEAWVVFEVCGNDEWAGGMQRLDNLRRALSRLADYWKIR